MRFKKAIIGLGAIGLFSLTCLIVIQFVRARSCHCENACVNNLRQIDGAKQTWALENNKSSNDVVTWQQIQPYLGRGPEGSIPVCPQGGRYILGRIGELPKCSIGADHSIQ
ncbi:MAG TPA: prepilin-type cleavage/methylation domain-containing protein [Verrucomicrobiae bacterium]|nr:prepilin-type cleavage/methylation domain-containing protein [Verrucomicrobiae bacterium]